MSGVAVRVEAVAGEWRGQGDGPPVVAMAATVLWMTGDPQCSPSFSTALVPVPEPPPAPVGTGITSGRFVCEFT